MKITLSLGGDVILYAHYEASCLFVNKQVFFLQVLQFGAELSDGGNVVDLSHIAPNTLDFIKAGESAMSVAKAYLSKVPPSISRDDIELAAPITKMDKVSFFLIDIL